MLKAQGLAQQAKQLLSQRKYAEALAAYTEAIATYPADENHFMGRATARCRLRRFEEAIADADCALRLNAKCPQALAIRARSLERGELTRAIEDASKAVQFDGTCVEAYSLRASAHLRSGAVEAAMADAEEAVRLGPASAEAFTVRGEVYLRSNQKDKAAEDFRRAVSLDDRFWRAYQGLAGASSGEGRRRLCMDVSQKESSPRVPKTSTGSLGFTWTCKTRRTASTPQPVQSNWTKTMRCILRKGLRLLCRKPLRS